MFLDLDVCSQELVPAAVNVLQVQLGVCHHLKVFSTAQNMFNMSLYFSANVPIDYRLGVI
jgi:hypothetical protein